MNSISQLNELPNANQLVVGQSLVIPFITTVHVIKYGDTLWSISQQYGVALSSIIQANPSTNPDLLYPGTTLVIPPRIHTVQSGETLWQIANRYGTTSQAIISENQIQNPNLIYPGTQLRIPIQ